MKTITKSRVFPSARHLAAMIACTVLTALPLVTVDADEPILDIPNPISFAANANSRTVGYLFTANDAIEVSHLGLWDDFNDGLTESHQVGIWTADGASLLTFVTVQAGTASETPGAMINNGKVRYERLSRPLLLNAGQQYVIGAHYLNDTFFNDSYIFDGSSVLTDSAITWNEQRLTDPSNTSGSLAYPNSLGFASRNGFLGPSFLFEPLPPNCLLGDVDMSGSVDFLDIAPFIAVLSNETNQCEADCDQSGDVTFLDIQPFIAILSAQ